MKLIEEIFGDALLVIFGVCVGFMLTTIFQVKCKKVIPKQPTPPQYIILSKGDTAWIKVEKKIVYDTTYQLKKP